MKHIFNITQLKKVGMKKTEYLKEKRAKCSELFPLKLTVRTLPLAENFSGRQTPPVDGNFLHNDKSSAVESNYVFKILRVQMQDLHFTAVRSPSTTDTKDGSACESLQTLEIRFTALDWDLLQYSKSYVIMK